MEGGADGMELLQCESTVEMKKQGYEVVVPYQENAWCYRDNAIINAEDYEKDHSQMQKLYPEYFPTKRMGGEVEKYRENGGWRTDEGTSDPVRGNSFVS